MFSISFFILESKVETECINYRHRIATVVHTECNSCTAQFGCVTGVMLPGLQVLNIGIELERLYSDSGE